MNPYRALIARNRNYRLLWFGQIVSQLGDWFNSVAVYALLLELTGAATSVALMIIVQFLPMALIGPVAGVVTDRVNRRTIMIAADILRGALVLGLLFVDSPARVWLVYALMALIVAATSFFEPARTAVIPTVTPREDLLTANALSSATWSAMLAIGAAAGGLVTAAFGRNTAFVINAISFFGSAVLIARTQFDAMPPAGRARAGLGLWTGVAELVDGVRCIRGDAQIRSVILVKAAWGMAGGVLLLMTVMGEREFRIGASAATGIGILYAARGVGAGIGPVLARMWLGHHPDGMRRAIAPSFLVVAVFYLALSWAPDIGWASVAVLGSHAAGSVLWVFSTVLLQLAVPDRFRGRVFSAELALVMVVQSLSSYACGIALDRYGMSPFTLTRVLGVAFVVPAIAWAVTRARSRGATTPPAPASPSAGGA